ncbi:MAG: DUF4956 domain-containing protein [Ectothiorhodospiraceae bacterium]|nr:DUF4956 domain-containing protein [Ectothiorhodospiraceae bacterium]
MLDTLGLTEKAPLSITALLISLLIGAILALVIRWHFRKFGSTLSNREEFAQVFPFILLTTVLIISVVKSSLALSLGLVGALSIVRFRTPIKEPEELAYLFVSIAAGLGLGAEQTIPTVVSVLMILVFMALFKLRRETYKNKNLFLSIDWEPKDGEDEENHLNRINELINKHAVSCDLRRYDVRDNSIELTYFVDIEATSDLSALTDEMRKTFSGVGITFLDQNQLPSV